MRLLSVKIFWVVLAVYSLPDAKGSVGRQDKALNPRPSQSLMLNERNPL